MDIKHRNLINTYCGVVRINSMGYIYFAVKGTPGSGRHKKRRLKFLEQVNGKVFRNQLAGVIGNFGFRCTHYMLDTIISKINNTNESSINIRNLMLNKPRVKLRKQYFINTEDYYVNILGEEGLIIGEDVWILLEVDFDGEAELLNIISGETKVIQDDEVKSLKGFEITEDYILKNFMID